MGHLSAAEQLLRLHLAGLPALEGQRRCRLVPGTDRRPHLAGTVRRGLCRAAGRPADGHCLHHDRTAGRGLHLLRPNLHDRPTADNLERYRAARQLAEIDGRFGRRNRPGRYDRDAELIRTHVEEVSETPMTAAAGCGPPRASRGNLLSGHALRLVLGHPVARRAKTSP